MAGKKSMGKKSMDKKTLRKSIRKLRLRARSLRAKIAYSRSHSGRNCKLSQRTKSLCSSIREVHRKKRAIQKILRSKKHSKGTDKLRLRLIRLKAKIAHSRGLSGKYCKISQRTKSLCSSMRKVRRQIRANKKSRSKK